MKIICPPAFLVHSDVDGHFQDYNKLRSQIYSILWEFSAAFFAWPLDTFFFILHPKV